MMLNCVLLCILQYVFTQQMERHDAELCVIMHTAVCLYTADGKT